MAIDKKDIDDIYDSFLEKTTSKLMQLQKDMQMEDEQLATVLSSVIAEAMQNSVNLLDVIKKSELIDKQILDVASTTAVRDAQSAKDLLLKDKQLETEDKRILDIASTTAVRDAQSTKDLLLKDKQLETEDKRILDIASTTAVRDAQSTKDLMLKDKQIATEEKRILDIASTTAVRDAQSAKDLQTKQEQYRKLFLENGGENGKSTAVYQQEKLAADTAFVTEQRVQLGYSVVYNNRIKSLDNYSDMIGNLGVGGFVISEDMWTTYFKMINDIYVNYGNAPVETTIEKPTSTTLTKP